MNKIITIYELLGLVKDGKAPKKIKLRNYIYEYQGDDYKHEIEDKEYWLFSDGYTKFNERLEKFLITKVEIIEDNDKLENIITFYDDDLEEYVAETKINGNKIKEHYGSAFEQMIIDKIKELIDHINKLEENK